MIAAVLLGAVLAAGAGGAWSSWPNVAPVAIEANRSGVVIARLPLDVDPGAGGAYPSVRIVDDAGNEIPYALDPNLARTGAGRDLPVSDGGFVPGKYSQAVIDLGAAGTLNGAVSLEVDRDTYLETVSVEASDDRATWRTIREGALIYRVARAGAGNQTIVFPPTRSRWLRVRIPDPRRPFVVTAAKSAGDGQPPPTLEPLPLAATHSVDAAARAERWTLDTGGRRIAAAGVSFSAGRGYYTRSVTVEASDDGEIWREVAAGDVSRFAAGGSAGSFAFAEERARFWRVLVADRNDRAVEGLRPALLARPRELAFRAEPGRRYALLSGGEITAPVYDFPKQLEHENWRVAARAVVAPSIHNASFAVTDDRPFTERYPNVVTGVFLVLAAGLAIVAVRALTTREGTG
jgi:hypothetical protein